MSDFHIDNLPSSFSDGSGLMMANMPVDLARFESHPTDEFPRVPGEFGDEGDYRETLNVNGDGAAQDTRNAQMSATVTLPRSYVAGSEFTLEIMAALTETINTSAFLDVTVYKKGDAGVRAGSDLCETSQQDCNSDAFTTYSFTIDGSGLVPGDKLLVTIKMSLNDTGSAIAGDKFGRISDIQIAMNARGGMIL
jgi:hypothetical protein